MVLGFLIGLANSTVLAAGAILFYFTGSKALGIAIGLVAVFSFIRTFADARERRKRLNASLGRGEARFVDRPKCDICGGFGEYREWPGGITHECPNGCNKMEGAFVRSPDGSWDYKRVMRINRVTESD